MEHNRSTKVVAIVALVAAVLGLSVGFSAYSRTLNIQNVQATVKGNASNFNVAFSTASNSASAGEVEGSASAGITTGTATLTGTTISNLTATFPSTGSITYTFYVYNSGSIPAYLTNVTFGSKTCAGSGGADNTLVQAACNDVTVSVEVGTNSYTATGKVTNSTALAAGKSEQVVVTINNTATHKVDGDFTATIPTITLNYSSQKAT